VPLLARVNIPAPVIGGLLVAGLITALRARDMTVLQLDTTLQAPLMIAFFTTVGFGASLSLLRVGGPAVIVFLLLSTLAAVLQNVVGAAVAAAMGQNPLMGVLAGSVTLTGGPATGLAFAPLFEQAGVPGAATLAVAAAMAGIVSGGLIGGPIGTRIIESMGLRAAPDRSSHPTVAANVAEADRRSRRACPRRRRRELRAAQGPVAIWRPCGRAAGSAASSPGRHPARLHRGHARGAVPGTWTTSPAAPLPEGDRRHRDGRPLLPVLALMT
jgi:ESS family glutamate:Na+ symporter